MTTLGIILSVVFAIYIMYIVCRYGIQESISESFYHAGWWFTIWCYVEGIGVAALMLSASEGAWYQFLGFFAGAGLCLVGTAPRFKSFEKTTHYVGAGVCAVSALTWMVLAGWWIVPTVALTTAAIATAIRKKYMVFWFEAALFTAQYIVLITNAIQGR
jgi:hypothetical protein